MLLFGFGLARLINYCHKRARLPDNKSDLSDHTRHLLHLHKCARRGSVLWKRRCQMTEEEQRKWQQTVLSMWQNRSTTEEDDGLLDEHGAMLRRLRDAWIQRRRCHTSHAGHSTLENCGGCSDDGKAEPWTPEKLQAEVRRVALTWLSRTRQEAALHDRRRRSSHKEMMRRLSWARRNQDFEGQEDHMRTIEEGEDRLEEGEDRLEVGDGRQEEGEEKSVSQDRSYQSDSDHEGSFVTVDMPQERMNSWYEDAIEEASVTTKTEELGDSLESKWPDREGGSDGSGSRNCQIL